MKPGTPAHFAIIWLDGVRFRNCEIIITVVAAIFFCFCFWAWQMSQPTTVGPRLLGWAVECGMFFPRFDCAGTLIRRDKTASHCGECLTGKEQRTRDIDVTSSGAGQECPQVHLWNFTWMKQVSHIRYLGNGAS